MAETRVQQRFLQPRPVRQTVPSRSALLENVVQELLVDRVQQTLAPRGGELVARIRPRGEGEPASRLQYATNVGEDDLRISDEVQDEVRRHRIESLCSERELGGIALDQARLPVRPTRCGQHLRG